jgi:hypothetical protein
MSRKSYGMRRFLGPMRLTLTDAPPKSGWLSKSGANASELTRHSP